MNSMKILFLTPRFSASLRLCGELPPRTLPLERGVERDGGWREVDRADEAERLGSAVLTIHPAVLPLDREWALVADTVQGTNDRLELDVAVAGRHEIPAAAAVAKIDVGREDAVLSVDQDLRIFDVDVVNPVG